MGASQFWLLQRTQIPNNLSFMQFSLEAEIGIGLGLLAILGTGAIMIYPTQLWIGRTMIATAVAGLFLLGFQHFEIWRLRTPAAGMIISATAFLLSTIWYFWPVGSDSQQTDAVAASIIDHNQKPLEETPLPPNAKFRYKGKIFWAISRPYSKDENSEIRIAFREIYDCIKSNYEPIIANYDGPAPMFTREWLSIIEKQGANAAIQKLTEIRTAIRFAATELQGIVKRRPYFSDEIRGMIADKGEIGIMNVSLNDYIESLKSIPHGASPQLIKLAVGNQESNL